MITKQQIPSFPRGWKILNSWEQESDPRGGVVLCEREEHEKFNSNFVTWMYNRIEGGCFWGHYFVNEKEARVDYSDRIGVRG